MSPAMAKGDAIGTAQDMDPEDNEDHVQSLLKLVLIDNLIQENTDLEDEGEEGEKIASPGNDGSCHCFGVMDEL